MSLALQVGLHQQFGYDCYTNMDNQSIDNILKQINQGKRCYWAFVDDEFSTVVSIEQSSHDLYTYSCSTSHQYDVLSPTQYEHRILDEDEVRAVFSELPDDVFDKISYVEKNIINEKTRDKVDLIYSFLRQKPKIVYVVFKEDNREESWGERAMNFNSLFGDLAQAQQMVDYLRDKQGIRCYWKEVVLSLNGKEMELHGAFAPLESVNSKQILVTLLEMDAEKIANFFEG